MVVSGKVPPFGLRLPPDLKEKLGRSAESEGRSLNTEIIKRLVDSYKDVRREQK